MSQFEREKYVLSEALVEDGEDLLETLVAEVLDPLQAVVGERHPDKCSVVKQKRRDPNEKVDYFMFQICRTNIVDPDPNLSHNADPNAGSHKNCVRC